MHNIFKPHVRTPNSKKKKTIGFVDKINECRLIVSKRYYYAVCLEPMYIATILFCLDGPLFALDRIVFHSPCIYDTRVTLVRVEHAIVENEISFLQSPHTSTANFSFGNGEFMKPFTLSSED